MPDFSAITEVSWTDPRVLFLLGLVLATILGGLVFLALQMERRRLLAASKQEDAERLGRAFEGTGLGFWDWDIARGLFSYDEEWFAAHLGYRQPDKELGLDFMGAITHPEDLPRKNDALFRHLVGRTDSYSAEFRLRRKNGSWVWILSRGKVFERGKDGQALRFAGADSVIEQQKTAELVLEIEKEVAVRFGEVYTPEAALQALAEGLVRLPDFEFSAVFLRKGEAAAMERLFSRNLPAALEGVRTLERDVGRERIHYFDENEIATIPGAEAGGPLSVIELRIVRNGFVAGCVWVGAPGTYYAPGVIMEAIEQLEIQSQGAFDRIESEAYYRAGQRNLSSLINSIDEMIFILDEDYRIVYANDVVRSELLYERDDLLGTNLLDLIPGENREMAREHFSDLTAGNLPMTSAHFRKKGQGLVQVEVQMTVGRWGESDARFCVVRNAGRRDEATRALERRDQRLRAASKALVELITAPKMESGIHEAIRLVSTVFEADRIRVSEKTGDDGPGKGVPTNLISCWTRDGSPVADTGESGWGGLGAIDLPEWTEALRSGRSVAEIRDHSSEKARERLESMGVRSLLLVPIHLRDVWWGVMSAELREEAREWTAGDISLLEIVGSGMAGLVETVRLQRDLIEAKDETEKTNRELGEAIRHAEEMAEEASRANRSKTEFLANMSHEIRTPMNAILGFSELIEAEVDNPALLEFLGAIHSSGKTLLALINDLLDLSKIEAGKMSLQYEPLSLRDLANDMANIFQVRCREKGIRFESKIAPDLPDRVVLDEARVRQIIFNLLGNAVKFTHEGRVELEISSRPRSEGVSEADIRVEVADTGIGIGREDQRSIFEPFEQSRGQKQRVYGGTGLGLSITSRLAKMMGGELSVSSVPDEGSVFVVDLPRVAVVATPAEDSAEDAPRGFDEAPRFPDGRVLVVDDNATNRQVLAASLDSLGIEVRSAVDGEDCLARFRSFRPDLVLLDLLMPGLSGEEVALRIRGGGEGADTPVVACTAVDLPQAKEIAARAGIDDILVKPVSQKALARVLGKHLRRAGAGADGSGVVAEEPPPPVVDGAAPGNLDEVVRRLEEDFAPDWDQLRRRLRIAPILRASENLKALGNEYEVSGIVEYAEELRYWIGLFDVEKLKEAMDRFPDLLERYRARLPGEEVSP